MKNIESLRGHLFDQLNRLAEADNKEDMDKEIERASSVVQVSDAIIRTAQVENQFIAITKGNGSGFIPILSDVIPQKSLSQKARDAQNDKE